MAERSDARINEDVCDRLCDSGEVDATEVEVRVSDGEVTLSGSVSDRNQKRRAEDLIEKVSGVREVHNNLRVGHGDGASSLRSSAASAAASPRGMTTPGGPTGAELPGNVLGVTGAPDKTITAGRRRVAGRRAGAPGAGPPSLKSAGTAGADTSRAASARRSRARRRR